MKTLTLLPILGCLLAGCGAASQGGGDATASAGSKPLPPGTIQVAAVGGLEGLVEPKQGPGGLAAAYDPIELNGARGNEGLYWLRTYRVGYSNRVITIQPLPKAGLDGLNETVPAAEQLVWKDWEMEVIPHQSATTFTAPTLDGRQAWLTVHHDGRILGGGYHDLAKSSDSYLRLGNPEQDLGFGPPETKDLVCGNYSAQGAPVDPALFGISIRLDRSRFPWASVALSGAPAGFNGDPGGQAWQAGQNDPKTLVTQGDRAIATIGTPITGGSTEYTFRNGRVESIRHVYRHSAVYCQ